MQFPVKFATRWVARSLTPLRGAYRTVRRLSPADRRILSTAEVRAKECDALIYARPSWQNLQRSEQLLRTLAAEGLSVRLCGMRSTDLPFRLVGHWLDERQVVELTAPKLAFYLGEPAVFAPQLGDSYQVLLMESRSLRADQRALARQHVAHFLGSEVVLDQLGRVSPYLPLTPFCWPAPLMPFSHTAPRKPPRDSIRLLVPLDLSDSLRKQRAEPWLSALSRVDNPHLQISIWLLGGAPGRLTRPLKRERVQLLLKKRAGKDAVEALRQADVVRLGRDTIHDMGLVEALAYSTVPLAEDPGELSLPWDPAWGFSPAEPDTSRQPAEERTERLCRWLDSLRPEDVARKLGALGEAASAAQAQAEVRYRSAIESVLEAAEHRGREPLAARKPRSERRLIDVYLTTSKRPEFLDKTLPVLLRACDLSSHEFRINVFVDQLDAGTLKILEPELSRLSIVTTHSQLGLPFLYNLLLSHQQLVEERSERAADYLCYIQDDCLIRSPERYFALMIDAYEQLLPASQVGYVSGFYSSVHPGFELRQFQGKNLLLSDSIDGKNFMAPPRLMRSVGPLSWYSPIDGERRGNPGPDRGSHFDLWQWRESPHCLMQQQRVCIVIPDLCTHLAQSAEDSTWGNETSQASEEERRRRGRVYDTRGTAPAAVRNEF